MLTAVASSRRFNRGRGRKMPPEMERSGPLVHKSVKVRMERVPDYTPKVRDWASFVPTWVD